jgi:CRP/FNR family transcriptional activator FtrB
MNHTSAALTASSQAARTSAASPARQALSSVPWLRRVAPASLDWLADHAVLHRIPAGSVLFEQAEVPAFAQFLLAGRIGLLGRRGAQETLIEALEPVDLVIPAAVLNRRPYLMGGRALTEAQVLMLEADAFCAAVAVVHALCLAVLACQAAQFRRQVRNAKNLKLRSAEERVGRYLLSLLDATGTRQARLPLEKRLIASQLGMTRETFSRTLAAMPRHGLRIAGDVVDLEDAAAARARFPAEPLIDGAEDIVPLPQGKN